MSSQESGHVTVTAEGLGAERAARAGSRQPPDPESLRHKQQNPIPEGSRSWRARLSPLRSVSCTLSLAFSWRRCCFLSCRSFKIIFKIE